jgi:hypothetical protein
MSFIYLASPYSHSNPAVRHWRFKAVNEVAAVLMSSGHIVFSPISHSHPIALDHDLPKGWEFWGRIDSVFVSLCSHVCVLMLPGWEISEGIKEEIELGRKHGKEILYLQAKED